MVKPLSESDFGLVASWLMDEEINRWLYAEWRERQIDEKLIAITSMSGKNHMWLAQYDGAPYGLVTIGNICKKDHSGVLWYLRGSGVERQSGVMTKCVSEVLKQAFEELCLHSISAATQAGNLASEHLLRTLGFKPAGTLREAFVVDGEFVDRNQFDLLKDDLKTPVQ